MPALMVSSGYRKTNKTWYLTSRNPQSGRGELAGCGDRLLSLMNSLRFDGAGCGLNGGKVQ